MTSISAGHAAGAVLRSNRIAAIVTAICIVAATAFIVWLACWLRAR